LAQVLIHKTLADQPCTERVELRVPTLAVGQIIGRGGETIRRIQTMSRCKVDVSRKQEDDGTTKVSLRGTKEQVAQAERMLNETLAEALALKSRIKASVEARSPRLRRKDVGENTTPTLFLTAENGLNESGSSEVKSVEKLDQSMGEKGLGVFVSAISDPGKFYVQKVGAKSIELDKLVQDMTDYYKDAANRDKHRLQVDEITQGDVVVTLWPGDDKWYRAKVVEVVKNEYDQSVKVDLDFVDFGDCEKKSLDEVFDLRTDFLKLSFQAIECTLAGVKSAADDGKWSSEASDVFERLVKCAQWVELQADIVDYKQAEGKPLVPAVVLTDSSSGDVVVDVAEELIKLGHAQRVTQLNTSNVRSANVSPPSV